MRILTRLSQISTSSHRWIFLISGCAGAGPEYEEERLRISSIWEVGLGEATGENQAVVLATTTSTITIKLTHCLTASGSHQCQQIFGNASSGLAVTICTAFLLQTDSRDLSSLPGAEYHHHHHQEELRRFSPPTSKMKFLRTYQTGRMIICLDLIVGNMNIANK